MKDINKMILVGRLGTDPIQRQTKSGMSVAHFSVATSRRIPRDSDPAKSEPTFIEETQWHRVVAWARLGEACAQYLKKGSTVYVEGFIKSHLYEDQTGKTRTSVEVYAENISFLDSRKSITSKEQEEVAESSTA